MGNREANTDDRGLAQVMGAENGVWEAGRTQVPMGAELSRRETQTTPFPCNTSLPT
jgi:hypothetical protein